MTLRPIALALRAALVLGLGCADPTPVAAPPRAPESVPAPSAPPVDAGPAPVSMAPLVLAGVSMIVDAPQGARALGGVGPSVRVTGPDGACAANVSRQDASAYFPTFAATVETIEKGVLGTRREFLQKTQRAESDWTLHYSKSDPVDVDKLLWAVDVRRQFGQTQVSCTRVGADEADVRCALAVCSSLRPVGGEPATAPEAKPSQAPTLSVPEP
ncbi:MAG: hypothetical protein ACOYM9_00420 [Bradymonadia bacterium]